MSTGAFTLTDKREARRALDVLNRYARQLEGGLCDSTSGQIGFPGPLARHCLEYDGDYLMPSQFLHHVETKIAGMEEALGGAGLSLALGAESLLDVDVKRFDVVSITQARPTPSASSRVAYKLKLPSAVASRGTIVDVAPCHADNWSFCVTVAEGEPPVDPARGHKRARPGDRDWDDAKRMERLKELSISKLVAMTDAAARLGAEVIDQTAFDAWDNLLAQSDEAAKKEAQRVFDKKLFLPAPPAPGGPGPSQTTAGAVLDGLVAARSASA